MDKTLLSLFCGVMFCLVFTNDILINQRETALEHGIGVFAEDIDTGDKVIKPYICNRTAEPSVGKSDVESTTANCFEELGLEEMNAKTEEKNCTFVLKDQSKKYFQSRLIAQNPNFVHFQIRFNVTPNTSSSEAFFPLKWVWTYNSPTANYPYLYWNLDHGLLSFGLLDVKTIAIEYVEIDVSDSCNVDLGSYETTWNIVETLQGVFKNMSTNSYHKYEQSFLCYLEKVTGVRDTFLYTAALYFKFPSSFLKYKCCELYFDYRADQYLQNCSMGQHEKWQQCTLGPYILGLVLFMYFPILIFQISAWLSKGEIIKSYEQGEINENVDIGRNGDQEWIYLNGEPPCTLFESLNVFGRLGRQNPIFYSRIRRLIAVIITPVLIYIQIHMYSDGIGIESNGVVSKVQVADLVKEGTPMGFLALLGDRENRNKSFAPIFGGPMCLLIMYYVLGIVFLLFPRSLKQIVELGIPRGHHASPLFLDMKDIIKLSMLTVSPDPGYENGSVVCKCSIYMLLTSLFWKRVYTIQLQRVFNVFKSKSCAKSILYIMFLPLYAVFCVVEIIVCVIFYAIPMFSFVSIMVKGAVKSILMFRLQNRFMYAIFRNSFTTFIGTVTIFTAFLFFCYSVCLIFIQSFSFVSQIIIFCFVAVIVYPSSSFGYLFFFLVLLYYMIRLIKDFGAGYLELLSTAVEKSRELYIHANHMAVCQDQILLFNIQSSSLKGIRINDKLLEIPQEILRRLENHNMIRRISERNNKFGIPRKLFDSLVMKYRPVHIQVMKILFRLTFVVVLVTMTMSINSKFETGSDISDVMHVIFIVTVGALPRVLEFTLTNSNERVMREKEMRDIEESIKEYWTLEEDNGFVVDF